MRIPTVLALGTLFCLSACGGGSGGGGSTSTSTSTGNQANSYAVGGYTAGLVGSGLAVSYNGGAPISISTSGAFTLTTSAQAGSNYTVSIATQPTNPAQACTVTNGSGSVGNADIFSVLIFCPQSVGRFAYVSGWGFSENNTNSTTLGTLSAYAIDPSSGALSLVPGSTVVNGPVPEPLVPVPHSTLAMDLSVGSPISAAAPYTAGTIFAYSIDSATGVPTALNDGNPYTTLAGNGSTPGCSAAGLGNTISITFTPSGTFGYVINAADDFLPNAGVWQFNWNSDTGAPSFTGSQYLGCEVPGPVTIDPSGAYAYVPAYSQAVLSGPASPAIYTYSINPATGLLTQVSLVDTNSSNNNGGLFGPPVVLDPYGRFAYFKIATPNWSGIDAFTIDPTSHALTLISSSPVASIFSSPTAIAIAPSGRFAFVTGTNGIATYAIDQATGALSPSPGTPGAVPVGGSAAALQIDPSGQFGYVVGLDPSAESNVVPTAWAVYGFSIDAASGQLTPIPGSPFAATSGNLNPAAVSVFN